MKMPDYLPAGLQVFQLPNDEPRFLKQPGSRKANDQPLVRHSRAEQALRTHLCKITLEHLTEKGCNLDDLLEILLRFANLELKPSTGFYRKAERRELDRLVKDLEDLSRRLVDRRWSEVITLFAEGPVRGPSELSSLLMDQAAKIKGALERDGALAQSMSGVDNLVILESYVRGQTGLPHYSELAILLAAIYEAEISPEKLRAHVRTHERTAKRGLVKSGQKRSQVLTRRR